VGSQILCQHKVYCRQKLRASGKQSDKCKEKAKIWEKIWGPSIGRMHDIHLTQEHHYSQLAMVCCWRLAAHDQSFLEASWMILDNPGLFDLNQHWHQNSILCTRFWVATCVNECRFWEIKWDMQLNAHGPMAISMRRKRNGNLVQTLAIGVSRQKNWGQGTKACIVNG
jgi:hypothetical protein